MPGRGQSGAAERAVIYCVIPRELAPKLHDQLRRHFRDLPSVEVVVEHRARERRRSAERRTRVRSAARERRRIRAVEGRRVADRRAAELSIDAPPHLPRKAQPYLERIVFVERLEPSSEQLEDRDTARLVTRIQAGDADLFADLYMRYFDRIYAYLRVALRDAHEAEDVTQQVFMQVLEALPRYERRGQPFRAWLFVIVRNLAVSSLRRRGRLELQEVETVNRRRELREAEQTEPAVLDWISDRELLMFVERLPLAQRQVLLLRYMLGLSSVQTASVLGLSADQVRALQRRALVFLKQRLEAVGRGPERGELIRMHRWRKQATVLRERRFVLAR